MMETWCQSEIRDCLPQYAHARQKKEREREGNMFRDRE